MGVTDPRLLLSTITTGTGATDECFLWPYGPKIGYGVWRRRYVHRLVYEHVHGPIPAGMHVHHLCENGRCINPGHLVALSPGEHIGGHNRTDACVNGHPYPESKRSDGRGCAVCHRERVREARRRERAAIPKVPCAGGCGRRVPEKVGKAAECRSCCMRRVGGTYNASRVAA